MTKTIIYLYLVLLLCGCSLGIVEYFIIKFHPTWVTITQLMQLANIEQNGVLTKSQLSFLLGLNNQAIVNNLEVILVFGFMGTVVLIAALVLSRLSSKNQEKQLAKTLMIVALIVSVGFYFLMEKDNSYFNLITRTKSEQLYLQLVEETKKNGSQEELEKLQSYTHHLEEHISNKDMTRFFEGQKL